MSDMGLREPQLNQMYLRFLDSEDPATFIKSVSRHYTLGTLSRLARTGSRMSRRGASLALGFIGDYSVNAVLGMGLRDTDRGVRMVSENGLREIWRRDGSVADQRQLGVVIRLNNAGQFHEALDEATDLLRRAPWFAEAWNQRAIAWYQKDDFAASVSDCRQTLELNPYHFPAAVGLAHCYLELGDGYAALESFRRALRLNPDMEAVRTQIEYLQKTLDG